MKIKIQNILLILFIALLGAFSFFFINYTGKQVAHQPESISNSLRNRILSLTNYQAKILIDDKDINQDGFPDALAYVPAGFAFKASDRNFACRQLILISLKNKKYPMLLKVDERTIVNETQKSLISQITAHNGYLVELFDHEGTTAFSISIADSLGKPITNPLNIYWNKELNLYSVLK